MSEHPAQHHAEQAAELALSVAMLPYDPGALERHIEAVELLKRAAALLDPVHFGEGVA